MALIEGIDNAQEIRNQIMTRVKRSTTTGLGDEHVEHTQPGRWSPAHITLLHEIRDAASSLSD